MARQVKAVNSAERREEPVKDFGRANSSVYGESQVMFDGSKFSMLELDP